MRSVNRIQCILLALLCCLACGQNQALEVQRYLADTDRSLEEFCQLGTDLEALGSDLQAQVKGDYSKAHLTRVALVLQPRLEALATRGGRVTSALRARPAPEAARDYRASLLDMLEPFEKGLDVYTRLTAQMRSGQGVSMTTFGGTAGELVRALETAQSAARRAQEQRQKLIDRYHLPVGPGGLVEAVKS